MVVLFLGLSSSRVTDDAAFFDAIEQRRSVLAGGRQTSFREGRLALRRLQVHPGTYHKRCAQLQPLAAASRHRHQPWRARREAAARLEASRCYERVRVPSCGSRGRSACLPALLRSARSRQMGLTSHACHLAAAAVARRPRRQLLPLFASLELTSLGRRSQGPLLACIAGPNRWRSERLRDDAVSAGRDEAGASACTHARPADRACSALTAAAAQGSRAISE